MDLSKEQLNFLNEELNVTKKDIESMSADEWKNIREKCFYIESDELLDIDDEDEETMRCKLATSIANIKFSDLNKTA